MTVRPRRPLATSLALLLALAPACTKEAAAETEELSGAKAREAVRVVTETLVQREVVRKLETSTRVESESGVQVFPRASGVVTAVSVEEGDVVAAGAMLAQLDDRDARLRLDDARAGSTHADISAAMALRILRLSGNKRLEQLLTQMSAQIARYTRLGLSAPQRRAQSLHTWRALVRALARRDGLEAEQLGRQLVNDTLRFALDRIAGLTPG